jgi:hypothetical protein
MIADESCLSWTVYDGGPMNRYFSVDQSVIDLCDAS